MLREDGPCPLLEGPEQDEGLDPQTKKQKIHQLTLVNTMYARVLGATAVSHWMYSFETELECYLSEPISLLAHLANKFLCPPPSTVPSEGVISEVGMHYEARRSRLTGHHAHQLCFRHYNLRLLNF